VGGSPITQGMVAAVVMTMVLCGAFVLLTRVATTTHPVMLRSLLSGLSFFLLPLLVLNVGFAGLWALVLAGAWAVRSRPLTVPPASVLIPDRLPDDWA